MSHFVSVGKYHVKAGSIHRIGVFKEDDKLHNRVVVEFSDGPDETIVMDTYDAACQCRDRLIHAINNGPVRSYRDRN